MSEPARAEYVQWVKGPYSAATAMFGAKSLAGARTIASTLDSGFGV